MRDRLCGYVLGALDAHEHEEVERLLSSDSRMCDELELVRKALAPLECDKGHHEPPFGLADTTCRRVAALRVERVHPADRRAGVAAGAARPRRTLFGWSPVDVAVAAAILLAAGALFFPAVNHSRFNAQVTRCQDNLATIGRALTDYSSRHDDKYPAIPVNGKLSAAGLYAPLLMQNGHIAKEKDNVFRCPSDAACAESARIPTMEVLEAAPQHEVHKLLRRAGGSFGYTLGYDDAKGEYQTTMRRGRTNFPIMSDAPCPKLGFQQSSNHGGHGQNVLYDDGHVHYTITSPKVEGAADVDIFHNDAGDVAAGKHPDDAVIGSSTARPRKASLKVPTDE